MKKIIFKLSNNNINFKKLIKILKEENKSSILANLSSKNIIRYLQVVINSNNLKLFLIIKRRIIGYAIIAKKPKYLIIEFEKLKYFFLIDLILRLKFMILFNIAVSIFGFDSLFKKRANKKNFYNSINLSLLAVEKRYQSQGLGRKFLKYIIKNNGYNSKFFSCETDNDRSKKFYIQKLKFKTIGRKIRVPKFMDVLIKKIK